MKMSSSSPLPGFFFYARSANISKRGLGDLFNSDDDGKGVLFAYPLFFVCTLLVLLSFFKT